MMIEKLFAVILFSVISLATYGQASLKGRVSDGSGRAIAGATVSVPDRRTVAVTDSGGRFEIFLSRGDTVLKVSHVGYSADYFPVRKGASYLEFMLKDASRQLEEVDVAVQTGYQSIPKERATGSFEQITGRDLLSRVSTNILENLEGRASGLQFDNRTGQSVINIRGINTMSDNMMGPLIVVDNFPFEGELSDINPVDVESVTLLKDAAASSIWGARAGNGVIVINMKKPIMQQQGIKVSITSNLSITDKPRLFDMPQISSEDFIELEKYLFEKGHYTSAYNNVLNSRTTVFSPVVDLLFDHSKVAVTEAELNASIESFKTVDLRDDLLRYFYRQTVLQQYNASLSGGSDKKAWLFSLGFDKHVGGMVGQRRQKITSNLQHTLALGRSMKLALLSRFTRNDVFDNSARFDYNYTPGGGRTALYPYAKLVGNDGSALAVPNSYNIRYVEGLQDGQLLDWMYRPYAETGLTPSDNRRNHLVSQLNWTYSPIKGLDLAVLYNNEIQNEERNTVYKEGSFFARNLINRFSQIDGKTVKYIVPKAGIRTTDNLRLESHKLRGGAVFNRSFLDRRHAVSAIWGMEISNATTENNGSRSYGYDPNLLNVQTVDYVNTYPIYDGLAGNSRIPYVGGYSKYINRFVSYYGNGSYTYRERYVFTVSGRKDASNLYGVRANDRWKPLWSSGLGWILTKEKFMEDVAGLDYLKIRGTYGHSGNSGGVSSSYALISHSNALALDLAGQPYAQVSKLPNPNLKWEDVRTVNVGLDLAAFANRLTITFDYFDKRSTDLISPDEIDPTIGINSVSRNVGVVVGKGFDVSLTGNIPLGRIIWSGKLFLSNSRTRTKEYKGTESLANAYLLNTGTTLTPLLDRELYPVFALRFAGLDPENGDPKGYLSGEESKDYAAMLRDSLQNIRYYGTALPPYYGSFSNSFRWKGFEVSFMMMFKFGHYFQKKTILYNSLFNSWNGHSDFAERWQNPGDESRTTVPSLIYPVGADRDNFYAYSGFLTFRGQKRLVGVILIIQ